MALIRAIKSAFTGAGNWIQEAYAAIGQKVAERLETASDALAEKRYRSEHRANPPETVIVPKHQVIELKPYGVINGHKHPN
jgi:hypothetical protein